MPSRGSRWRKTERTQTDIPPAMDEESAHMVHDALMEIVDHQLRDNDPPETKQTLERLMVAGYPESESCKMIACVVLTEIYDVLKYKRDFDRAAFIAALHRLPTLPWE